jgi:PAS domain S-box-containing protein
MSHLIINLKIIGLLILPIFSFSITFALLHFYLKDKDKRKLMFFLSFFTLSLTYLFLFIQSVFNLDSTMISTNFHQCSSLPILIAVFFAANDSYLKIKRFENLILFFSIFIIISYLMVFIPINTGDYLVIIRMILALEIIFVSAYLFIKTKQNDQLFFLFAIISMSISGMSLIENFIYLSIFGKIISLVFFSMIFFNKSTTENGVGAFFKLNNELKHVKLKLNEREQTFQTLFNNMADPVMIINKSGKFLELTDKVKDYTGYKKEEIIGKNFLNTNLLTRKSKAICLKHFINRMNGADQKPYEVEVVAKNGRKIPFEINAQRISYNGDKADLIVFRDLTERKEQQEKETKLLHESLFLSETASELNSFPLHGDLYEYIGNKIKELSGNTLVIISSFDEKISKLSIINIFAFQSIIKKINTSLGIDITNISETVRDLELLKKIKKGKLIKFQKNELQSVLPSLISHKLSGVFKRYINKDQMYHIGLVINDKIIGIITIIAFKDSLVENIKLIETFVNQAVVVFQRNIAMQELSEMNESLEETVRKRTNRVEHLLKQKDEFIHQLGHDLKNPLGPLINLLPIIEKKETDPKKQEMLHVINRNVSYMKNLVQKTLELARLNSSSIKFHFESINIYQKVNEIIGINQLMIQEKQIRIQNHIPQDILVNADVLRLEELFTNLLSNSVKYSENQGIIDVSAELNNQYILISIRDYGIGMNQSQLSYVFDEFYKADESRHDFESSGLGMPICKRIVELHGGKIWVESEGLGKGSVFYFTLHSAKKSEEISIKHNYNEIQSKVDKILMKNMN